MAASTITRATLTDSTGPSNGDIWNAALVGTALYDKIDALFTTSLRIERSSSGDIAFTVAGASNTAGSDSQLIVIVAGTSAGDPFATFTVTSGSSWSLGIDNSDSDKFKLCATTTLTTDLLVVTTGGMLLLNDNANADMTIGLTINQGANDDDILAFKSSDVAHGMTTLAETDSYGRIKKITGAGGVLLDGFVTGSAFAVQMRGFTDTTNATRSTAGLAPVQLDGYLKSGTTGGSLGADKNIAVIRDGGNTKFIFDSDGDSHEDGTGWTAYDDHDDLALIASIEGELAGDQLKSEFKSWMTYNRESLQRLRLVTFNEDGHHFVNRSRMQMALCGAVRQLGLRLQAAEQRLLAAGA